MKLRKSRLILDGHNLVFFSAHNRSAFSWKDAAALCLNRVSLAIAALRPSRVAICWDSGREPWRRALIPEYKESRKTRQKQSGGDALYRKWVRDAATFLETYVWRLGIDSYKCLAGPGEADDIMYVLSREEAGSYSSSIIVTSDTDLYQAVTPRFDGDDPDHGVYVISPRDIRQSVDQVLAGMIDGKAVYEKVGVWPGQYVWYKAMVGDTADDIAGVEGIGQKTAKELLATYGGMKGVLANIAKVPKSHKRAQHLATQHGLNLVKRNFRMISLFPPTTDPTCVPGNLQGGIRGEEDLGRALDVLDKEGVRLPVCSKDEWLEPFRELAERRCKDGIQ